MEYTDSYLINLSNEESQEAKEILIKKYEYIIRLLMNKYYMVAKKNKISKEELYQEALFGLFYAIKNFDDKSSSLSTFITVCVESKLKMLIRSQKSLKTLFQNDTLSLDYIYLENNYSLINNLIDNNQKDPQKTLETNEEVNEFKIYIQKILSKKEYEVFLLYLNNYNYSQISTILNLNLKQVDNALQRVKRKLKKSQFQSRFILDKV